MRRPDQGLTLVETLAALALLGVALLMAAAVVSWGRRLERRSERHAVALDVAQTLSEGLRLTPYASVGEGVVELDRNAAAVLPEGTVELAVEEDEELALKTVTIAVAWEGADPGRLELVTAIGARQVYR